MDSVKIISGTVQEFRGERFYLCGYYFQHDGKRLHRAVWEAYNGPIPEGYHVHHLDEDRGNNQIENLALMPGIEHVRQHARTEERRENGRRAIAFAIAAAPEWHRSEAGTAWHSEHARQYWATAPAQTYTCAMCGRAFESRKVTHRGRRFCSAKCRAAYGRRKRAELR